MTRNGLIAFLCLSLAACANTQNRHTDPDRDPWEGFNRKVFAFNDSLDHYLLRPVSVAYDKVMPDPFQRGVSNFFKNLDYPVTVLNQLFQGKFHEAGDSTGRFLVNSVIGVFGFFDVATKFDIPQYDEDFGQTLATWGYENSRYLVVPVFGPLTVRDVFGRSVYGLYHPVSWAAREEGIYWPMITDIVQTRAKFLEQDHIIFDSYDPYVMVRDTWLQNREYKIYDGNPPLADYDAYLDEIEEFEQP
jgi:phospholipid-binding lipoprotein MlaA